MFRDLLRKYVRPIIMGVRSIFYIDDKFVKYSGYSTCYRRSSIDSILEPIFPFLRDNPDYESGTILASNELVQKGDHVVAVGSGVGITALHAKTLVGDSGSVTVFEGGKKSLDFTIGTFSNYPDLPVTIIYSLVGLNIGVYGKKFATALLDPKDLPECDILELDCEGAELEIISNMIVRPRVIIVETHGNFGSPSARIEKLLISKGYKIKFREIADKSSYSYCEENDLYVLGAHLI